MTEQSEWLEDEESQIWAHKLPIPSNLSCSPGFGPLKRSYKLKHQFHLEVHQFQLQILIEFVQA
jgi:hypothetical protein